MPRPATIRISVAMMGCMPTLATSRPFQRPQTSATASAPRIAAHKGKRVTLPATEPRLLILDEPTRGIDVAAKQEIMEQILRLARSGMAVIFISSEMSEVVRVAHRIVVLRDRRKVGELPAGSSEEAVVELIAAEHA